MRDNAVTHCHNACSTKGSKSGHEQNLMRYPPPRYVLWSKITPMLTFNQAVVERSRTGKQGVYDEQQDNHCRSRLAAPRRACWQR